MLTLSLLTALATPPRPEAKPATERITTAETVLDNRMRVVVMRRPSWNTVSIATVIDGGLVAEPRAGLTQSLADSWHASRPAGPTAVSEVYERLGAESRVRVEPDSTVFWVHGPAEATSTLLALERQRFADPLRRVTRAALPSRDTVRQGWIAKYLNAAYSAIYPVGHPYHAIWREPPREAPALVEAAVFARTTWTPSRTTLVVAGPLEPREVLCALERDRCGGEAEVQEHASALALPEPRALPATTIANLPMPLHAELGPLAAGVPGEVVILGWSLPGTDAGTRQLNRLVQQEVEAGLQSSGFDATGAIRCHLFEGDANSTLLCLLPGDAEAELGRVERLAKKGWRRKGLEDRTERFRWEQLTSMFGASDDPGHVPRFAEQIHRGGGISVHAGELDELAFDAEEVRQMLQSAVDDTRMVRVRLLP